MYKDFPKIPQIWMKNCTKISKFKVTTDADEIPNIILAASIFRNLVRGKWDGKNYDFEEAAGKLYSIWISLKKHASPKLEYTLKKFSL